MQQRAEKTRAEILKAAEAEFSEFGFDRARMDSIASRAGVNKALIYKYYGNKEEIYKTVFCIVYNRFSTIEKQILTEKEGEDYKAKLRRFVEMEFDYCLRNPSYVRMIMWENLNYARFIPDCDVYLAKNAILKGIEEIVEEAKRAGTLMPSIDAKQILLTLYACCFNYFTNANTLSRIIGTDLMETSEMQKRIQAVTDMLLAYLDYGEKNVAREH